MEASATHETRARAGLVIGVDGEAVRFLDPITDAKARPEGEDPRGLLLRRSPRVLLLEEDEARPILLELLDGAIVETDRELRRTASSAEWEIVCEWLAAKGRRHERETEARLRKAKEGAN